MPSHQDRVRRNNIDFEWIFCPMCGQARRFEFKVHTLDYAGECGHRIPSVMVGNLRVTPPKP